MEAFPSFPLPPEEDDAPPPTLRSPISTLRVRDHAVAVELEVEAPQPKPARASGVYAIESNAEEVPTQRFRRSA